MTRFEDVTTFGRLPKYISLEIATSHAIAGTVILFSFKTFFSIIIPFYSCAFWIMRSFAFIVRKPWYFFTQLDNWETWVKIDKQVLVVDKRLITSTRHSMRWKMVFVDKKHIFGFYFFEKTNVLFFWVIVGHDLSEV